jgi:2-polyprenyl-6-methoxyphenol hydroxylase-like FAD-dependent oxidoreductase
MPEPRQITIIGGGLAGLTLGIGLRQQGIPVVIWEAGTYPRHRVCGEFISGAGLEVLRELNLWESLMRVGAHTGTTAAMVIGRKIYHHPLPTPALCLSRYKLDHVLAGTFQGLGGVLKTGSRVATIQPAEGLVRATGRTPHAGESEWHWFGLKAHVRNVALVADLEMHYSENGYVGLCTLGNNVINACGLFRRSKNDPKPGRDIPEVLRGQPGTLLFERLSGGEWDPESICTVAGLSFGPLGAFEGFTCCAGDVLRMIPPLTGNGMSIAFETARLALKPLTEFARGNASWNEAEDAMAKGYSEAFRSRFAWANVLQTLAFSPYARAFSSVFCSGAAFRFCFCKTR